MIGKSQQPHIGAAVLAGALLAITATHLTVTVGTGARQFRLRPPSRKIPRGVRSRTTVAPHARSSPHGLVQITFTKSLGPCDCAFALLAQSHFFEQSCGVPAGGAARAKAGRGSEAGISSALLL